MSAPEINRFEWDFSECGEYELEECHGWEFSRTLKWPRGFSFGFKNGFGPKIDTDFHLDEKWPDAPFLSLPLPDRRKRVEQLRQHFERMIPRFHYGFKFQVPLPHVPERRCKAIVTNGGTSVIVATEVSWTREDHEMVESFRDWLKEKRPKEFERFRQRPTGAGSYSRRLKTELKMLGAWRLLKIIPWEEAANFTRDATITKKKSGGEVAIRQPIAVDRRKKGRSEGT